MNWKLTLAYDGTGFHGWQIQPGNPTVQGELQAALGRVTGESPGSPGIWPHRCRRPRTRPGCQFSFSQARIPPENLQRALNRTLPASIRVLSAEHAPAGFHARHSVRAKTYEYRIFQTELCPPWSARYVYALNWPLNIDRMQQAAALVIGEHDFTSFAATDPDLSTRAPAPEAGDPLDPDAKAGNIRTIYSSSFTPEAEELLVYRVRGNGFLHHMVRNLVGTFIDVGRRHIAVEDITRILDQRARSAAGSTAPARGLFLDSVEY